MGGETLQTSLEVLSPTARKVASCVSFPGPGDPHVYALVVGVVRRDSDSGNLEMVSVVPWGAETQRGAGRNRTSFELASSRSPLESADTRGFEIPLGPQSPPAGGGGVPRSPDPGRPVQLLHTGISAPEPLFFPTLCQASAGSIPAPKRGFDESGFLSQVVTQDEGAGYCHLSNLEAPEAGVWGVAPHPRECPFFPPKAWQRSHAVYGSLALETVTYHLSPCDLRWSWSR